MDSKLQVFEGRFHGRKLFVPSGARPTQNRARLAVFNMLREIVSTWDKFSVWDAFAGSGAFGIEMMSRYPNARVYFSDISPESIDTVNKNLALVKPHLQEYRVHRADALKLLTENAFGKNVDITFIDPPYNTPDLGIKFMQEFGKIAKSGAVLIWEQEATASITPNDPNWEILRDRKYGRARFVILCRI